MMASAASTRRREVLRHAAAAHLQLGTLLEKPLGRAEEAVLGKLGLTADAASPAAADERARRANRELAAKARVERERDRPRGAAEDELARERGRVAALERDVELLQARCAAAASQLQLQREEAAAQLESKAQEASALRGRLEAAARAVEEAEEHARAAKHEAVTQRQRLSRRISELEMALSAEVSERTAADERACERERVLRTRLQDSKHAAELAAAAQSEAMRKSLAERRELEKVIASLRAGHHDAAERAAEMNELAHSIETDREKIRSTAESRREALQEASAREAELHGELVALQEQLDTAHNMAHLASTEADEAKAELRTAVEMEKQLRSQISQLEGTLREATQAVAKERARAQAMAQRHEEEIRVETSRQLAEQEQRMNTASAAREQAARDEAEEEIEQLKDVINALRRDAEVSAAQMEALWSQVLNSLDSVGALPAAMRTPSLSIPKGVGDEARGHAAVSPQPENDEGLNGPSDSLPKTQHARQVLSPYLSTKPPRRAKGDAREKMGNLHTDHSDAATEHDASQELWLARSQTVVAATAAAHAEARSNIERKTISAELLDCELRSRCSLVARSRVHTQVRWCLRAFFIWRRTVVALQCQELDHQSKDLYHFREAAAEASKEVAAAEVRQEALREYLCQLQLNVSSLLDAAEAHTHARVAIEESAASREAREARAEAIAQATRCQAAEEELSRERAEKADAHESMRELLKRARGAAVASHEDDAAVLPWGEIHRSLETYIANLEHDVTELRELVTSMQVQSSLTHNLHAEDVQRVKAEWHRAEENLALAHDEMRRSRDAEAAALERARGLEVEVEVLRGSNSAKNEALSAASLQQQDLEAAVGDVTHDLADLVAEMEYMAQGVREMEAVRQTIEAKEMHLTQVVLDLEWEMTTQVALALEAQREVQAQLIEAQMKFSNEAETRSQLQLLVSTVQQQHEEQIERATAAEQELEAARLRCDQALEELLESRASEAFAIARANAAEDAAHAQTVVVASEAKELAAKHELETLKAEAAASQATAQRLEDDLRQVWAKAVEAAAEQAALQSSVKAAEAARCEMEQKLAAEEGARSLAEAKAAAAEREAARREAEVEASTIRFNTIVAMQTERSATLETEKLALEVLVKQERRSREVAEEMAMSYKSNEAQLEGLLEMAHHERAKVENELREQSVQVTAWLKPVEADLQRERTARVAAEQLAAERKYELECIAASAEEAKGYARHLMNGRREAGRVRLRALLLTLDRQMVVRALFCWREAAIEATAAARITFVEHLARVQLMQQSVAFQQKLHLLEQQVEY